MLGSLQPLLLGGALGETSRGLLTDWMLNEQKGKARLRAGAPTQDARGDWRVANKPGTAANGAVNDICMAWPPLGGPLLMIAYTNAPGARIAAGEAAIAQAAELALREFNLV